MSQQKNKPVHEIRIGNIKSTIWKNDSADGISRYSVNVIRSYFSDGSWKTSDSYGRDDLPRVVKCADLAYEWIFEQIGRTVTDQETAQAIAA